MYAKHLFIMSLLVKQKEKEDRKRLAVVRWKRKFYRVDQWDNLNILVRVRVDQSASIKNVRQALLLCLFPVVCGCFKESTLHQVFGQITRVFFESFISI